MGLSSGLRGKQPMKTVPTDSMAVNPGKMGMQSSREALLFCLPHFLICSLFLPPTFSSSLQTGTCLKADQSGMEAYTLFSALTWERQENQHSFGASLVYIAHYRPASDMQDSTVSKKTKQNKQLTEDVLNREGIMLVFLCTLSYEPTGP